ncbi:transglutaminase family protein [Polynucleobacter paneuropaeus]|jgi:transglutaminase-like putative cysteine protease|nr:transglutaminase family protein [Polynucleobacter paneuropaeus]MBT8571938.1 transglutaminase family protein [Polynucleobacter paneuropaeus]MBT8572348.1 transglutaminase family protein [Polynucleobacter paneuropaeus]MBT8577595.1 transglutaminase family protein [Polynucleobacter paneuropaeus]MBT8603350.1 transglutaminase family protein [Polynucleobacter paneuropaeus]
MLLEITHDTHYSYDPNVEIAQHFAHLKPASMGSQRVLKAEIEVSPKPSWSEESIDNYGNICTFFSLQNRHSNLSIVAKSLIETRSDIITGPKPEDTPAWELVREYFRYHSNTKWDAASEFLFTSPFIALRPEFAEFARANFTTGRPILEAAIDLTQRIYGEFHYVTKSTDIGTPALKALEKREGVCQDFAHILIASLRSIGLPSKYISGYILTNPPPGQPRLIGGDASHAWVSIYVPSIDADGQLSTGLWCDLDPTNNRWGYTTPGDDYVHLAEGRDYADVSPIRGVIHGGADHILDVAVTVRPIEQ